MRVRNKNLIAVIVVAFIIITAGFFGLKFFLKNLESPLFIYQTEFPLEYNQPMTVSILSYAFSIKPLNAFASVKTNGEKPNVIKYIEAYKNTDVVQIKQTTKLKEDIILKQPGHPDKFEYQIDIDKYDFTRDGQGNLVFYKKGYQGDDLYKIFTIPAPFMIDANGKKSSIQEVRALFDRGILTLIPSQDWLDNAVYPIILDPTIEIHILNVHSYPKQGENWEVNFTTLGQADLKIIPNDQATIDDDEFVSLSCDGRERAPQILDGDVVFYPNWFCQGIGKVTHYTKKAGKHTLRFEFSPPGGETDVQIAWAYNNPEAPLIETSDITLSGTAVDTSSYNASYPAVVDAGDLIIWVVAKDDDPDVVDGVSNLTEIVKGNPGGSYVHPYVYVAYEIADGDEDGTTHNFTGDTEDWSVACIRVVTGEFDVNTPIGSVSAAGQRTYDNATAIIPAFTPNRSGGRVVAVGGIDFDPMDATFSPAGWTDRADQDIGDVTVYVSTRDAESVQDQQVDSATFGTVSDTSISWGFVVNGPLGPTAPTNDSLDLLNHSDGDEIYAGQQYTWQALVSDANGCTDIDTVVLQLDYDGSSQDITWTEATDNFASGSGFFTVDSTGSDSNCSGTQWTLDFKLTMDWDWEATDDTATDAQLVTTDDSTATDTDAYLTDTFQLENDLRVNGLSYDSTQNPSVSYSVTGYLDYEGVASPNPPEDAADILIDPSWTGTYYSDTDLEADGAFSINVTSDSSLGGAGTFDVGVFNVASSGAGVATTSDNAMDIDRVQITDIVISNQSYDSTREWDPNSGSMTATISAILEDAATAITAGTSTLVSTSYGAGASANINEYSGTFSAGDATVTLSAASYASADATTTYDNLYVSAISADSNNYGTALTHGTGIDEASERPDLGWDDVAPSNGSLAWGTINATDITVTPSGGSDSDTGLPTNKYYIAYDQATSFSAEDANSGWVNAAWNPTGLSANTAYAFVLKLRDNAGTESASWITPSPVYKYTLANTPNAPTLSHFAPTTINVNLVSGGAEKEMAIYLEEGASCDGSGGLGYVQANGSIDSGAIWQTDAAWGTITVTGLSEQTQYSFCVKARNNDDAETGFGSAASESCLKDIRHKAKGTIKFQGSIKF